MFATFARLATASLFVMVGVNNAGSETRRVQFEIEPIIILKCVEQVDYTLDTSTLLSASSARSILGQQARTTSNAPQRIEANFDANSLLEANNSAIVDIVVDNACSVRGLGRGEGFLVDVSAANEGVLSNVNAGGVLTVKGAQGKPSYAGNFSRRFSIPQSRISLDREIQIDVQVSVDLQFANGSGLYASPVDGVFSIEVSAP